MCMGINFVNECRRQDALPFRHFPLKARWLNYFYLLRLLSELVSVDLPMLADGRYVDVINT